MALIAGLAMAQVQSANTVGFLNKEVEGEGFTSISPTFVAVGTQDPLTLANLSGTFIEGESIQITDTEFATESEFFYCVKGSMVSTDTGWYADDFETPVNDTEIPIGGSILYQSQGTTSVTFAGEVGEENVVVAAEDVGFTAVGNPFPVDTTLGSVSFTGIAEGDSVQVIDSEAATESEYFYCVKGSMVSTDTGWYEDDFETPAGATAIAAGQGFLYQNASETSGVTITFTAPVID